MHLNTVHRIPKLYYRRWGGVLSEEAVGELGVGRHIRTSPSTTASWRPCLPYF